MVFHIKYDRSNRDACEKQVTGLPTQPTGRGIFLSPTGDSTGSADIELLTAD